MCHPSFSFIFFSHFMLLFFCFILAYFSFCTSCLMFSLAHVFDLVAFAFSFHPPRLSSSISVSSPLSLSLLSVLLALKAHFPLFLLHWITIVWLLLSRTDFLFFLLFFFCAFSLLYLSSLHLLLSFDSTGFSSRAQCLSFLVYLYVRYSPSLSFLHPWWSQELFILCRKVVRNLPPFG